MKILAVCGFGVGSSMILGMSIKKACKALNIEAEVENTDLTDARATKCDVIFTSTELAEELRNGVSVPVYDIKKYMNVEEVTEALKQYLKDINT